MANLGLRGRPDELTDTELHDEWVAGHAALKARITAANVHARAYRDAFRADSTINDAVAAFRAAHADIVAQLAAQTITQQQATDAIAAEDVTLKAAVASATTTGTLNTLRLAYRAARTEARPDAREEPVRLVIAEMKLRGIWNGGKR
jgi:predicted secreted hydrolase